jgi:hypothetical protein
MSEYMSVEEFLDNLTEDQAYEIIESCDGFYHCEECSGV